MITENKCSQLQDYVIKSQRLCIPFSITASATPANKVNSNDLPACMVLAMQGQTAAAAAIDSGTNFGSLTDSSGTIGILLYNLGTVYKLLNVSSFNLSSGTIAYTLEGSSNTGVTADGNIAVLATWSGNLSTTDLSGIVHVDYKILSTDIAAIG